MAMHCRSTRALSISISLLLILLRAASLVSAGVKTACADTPYPDYCATVVSAGPKSKSADARALAEIAVRAAAKTCAAAAALARTEEKGIKDGAWWCMDRCASDIEDAAARLGRKTVNITQVRSFIARTESDLVVWNCDECRRDRASEKKDLLSKDGGLEKIMGVVSALVKRVGTTRSATPSPAQAPAQSSY
jgi:pectinesterase inhibitor-like protein